MKEKAILVPPKVLSDIQDIWNACEVAPGEYQAVLAEAERRDSKATVQWLRNNQKYYLQGAAEGFAPDHE